MDGSIFYVILLLTRINQIQNNSILLFCDNERCRVSRNVIFQTEQISEMERVPDTQQVPN